MIRKYTWVIFLALSVSAKAQYKPDVIILGSTVAGSATAIQAARSGVKTLLIDTSKTFMATQNPSLNVPAFNFGLFKEWKDAYQKANDSLPTSEKEVLEKIVKNTKSLNYLSGIKITSITDKKGVWELKVIINGKTEEIKAKALVDASADLQTSFIAENNIINFDKDGNFVGLVVYDVSHQKKPYQQIQKLYRTSGAAGFGKDSVLLTIPLGVFIPREKENLLIISPAAFKGFKAEELQNTALWVNIGQAVGALAAYGPFFNTTPSKASIRITQGEMFTYKSFLYPVLDIKIDDYAWYPIQKVITSGLLKLDFEKGLFNPEEAVKVDDVKTVLSELYPRSRIWFIENKGVTTMSVKDVVSAISFTTGRDAISVRQEIEADWQNKYKFSSAFVEDKIINKKEMAVLLDAYLSPFNIGVDFSGYFLR
jgi:hypothetical protein